MKSTKLSFTRGLALFLCIVLLAAVLPTAALAGDYKDLYVSPMSTEKERKSYYLTPKALKCIEERFVEDNCATRSEFVDKAVVFYYGYLTSLTAAPYMAPILENMLQGVFERFGERIGKLVFKQAVELDMVMNIIASDTDIDYESLEKLRGKSVRDVKSTNGMIGFRDAVKLQKGL